MANVYIGSLIDFERSVLMNPERWTLIQKQMEVQEFFFFSKNKLLSGWRKRNSFCKSPK